MGYNLYMKCSLIFPNNLFENNPVINKNRKIYIFQDPSFFQNSKYTAGFNKKKILLHLMSTETYHNNLLAKNFDSELIMFHELLSENYLNSFINKNKITELHLIKIVDIELNKKIAKVADQLNIKIVWYENPLFILNSSEVRNEFSNKKRYLMANFYKKQRKNLNILIDKNSNPIGGKWSFDDENRKKFDEKLVMPKRLYFKYDYKILNNNKEIVEKFFPNNIGNLNNFNFPIDYEQSKNSLKDFLENKLELFGDYEDSISTKENYIFHSLISSYINIGLLTPKEIINEVLHYHEKFDYRLNSLEGFIRQIIGWREFIRGIYQINGEEQKKSNNWKFTNKIPNSFYNGTTGILPLDNVINSAIDNSYSHHIERLMIIGNIMMLLEISPNEVHKWFMEIYIDAYDWVMVPNVYGMSQFSDSGLMATKPYISSSKYILKMSNYKKDDWCNIWDSLYWRFIKKHQHFFESNPRMKLMVNLYEKKSDSEKQSYKEISNKYLHSLFK